MLVASGPLNIDDCCIVGAGSVIQINKTKYKTKFDSVL